MTDTIVLIPAYNESKNIKEIVSRVKKLGYTPLVIDDYSKDNTSQLAKEAGAVVVRHEVNKGKGEGIKTGFQYIFKNRKEKYVVLLDADLQYIPEDIPKVIEELQKNQADFVMGYRDWSLVPLRHRLGNLAWRVSFNLLFGTKMKDTNCGFMAMTVETAKKIKRIHGGYIIDNHIVSQVVKNKLKIGQVPVTIFYNHKSGVNRGIRMVLGVLFFIIKEGLKYRFGISKD